jgi:hypothetical protein
MAAHLFPSSACFAMMVCSSSGEKGSFLREGSSWLNQRKRQLFPFLPVDRFCGWKGKGGGGGGVMEGWGWGDGVFIFQRASTRCGSTGRLDEMTWRDLP